MLNVMIRNEMTSDYREVERLTRKAFWNVNVPGCNEHYLVHVLRKHPDYQRRGISKRLLENSFDRAVRLGYRVIVIFGNPDNYVSRGVQSCKRFNICSNDGSYPSIYFIGLCWIHSA